jgi:putative DNA methylase
VNEGGVGATAYTDAVATYLGLALDRLANYATTICTWHSGVKYETLTSTFGRQAIPMTWDFAEGNPLSKSSGNILSQVTGISANLDHLRVDVSSVGSVLQKDAVTSRAGVKVAISTDPPYYDNICYADL